MSNNKQSMKLYTEEQIKKIQQAILCNHKDAIMDENYCLNVTTPIELPSDEEIGKDIGSGMHDFYKGGFIEGAKWQQERMYSEEDMEKAFTNGLNRSFDSDFDRWFEQFKKK